MRLTSSMGIRGLIALTILAVSLLLTSCSGAPFRPCTKGSQPAREGAPTSGRVQGYDGPIGTVRCDQKQDERGKYVNDGKYYEWYENEHLALEGEYKMGKKEGRWIEYDNQREKVSEKYFKDGKEVSPP